MAKCVLAARRTGRARSGVGGVHDETKQILIPPLCARVIGNVRCAHKHYTSLNIQYGGRDMGCPHPRLKLHFQSRAEKRMY